MQIGHWMYLTSPWPGKGAPAEYLYSLSNTLGSWEEGASLGQASNMGNIVRNIVIF